MNQVNTEDDSTTFQLSTDAAEIYEAKFVPAIFAGWAPQLIEFAGVAAGDDVLDVACGTGIVARDARAVVGPGGSVVGVDLNAAMWAVAGRVEPGVDWRHGDATALPVDDASFDAVLCQMAFMFFPDPDAVLREMRRAARPGGVVAALVPAAIEDQPAYGPLVDLAVAEFGPRARPLLGAYWSCGDLDAFTARFRDVGLTDVVADTRSAPALFESPLDFVTTEVKGSPLGETTDDAAIARLGMAVGDAMPQWTTPSGGYHVPLACHLVAGRVHLP